MLIWLLATALGADRMVAVDVAGSTQLDQEAALPYELDHPFAHEGKDFVLRVKALEGSEDAQGVLYVVSLMEIKGNGSEKSVFDQTAPAPGPDASVSVAVKGKGRKAPELTVDLVWTPVATLPPHDETVPADWPKRRFLVLWNDADLYADVYRKTEPIQRASVDRTAPSAQASVYRAVGPWKGAVREVETVPTELAPHCYDSAPAPKDYPYQYFTESEALLTVTTEPVTVSHDDGTSIRLAAGVVAVANGDGTYDVDLGGLSFTLPLPEASVGEEYMPSAHFSAPPIGLAVQPGADGVVGTAAGVPIRLSGEALALHGRTGVQAKLVTTRIPCAEIRFDPGSAAIVADE